MAQITVFELLDSTPRKTTSTSLPISLIGVSRLINLIFQLINPSGRYFLGNRSAAAHKTKIKTTRAQTEDDRGDNNSKYVNLPPRSHVPGTRRYFITRHSLSDSKTSSVPLFMPPLSLQLRQSKHVPMRKAPN